VWFIATSPDRRRLATASFDSCICVWDAETYQLRTVLCGHDDPVYSVVFLPDGRTLASGGHDRTVRLWDLATGIERRRLESHTGAVNAVAISPDGRRLASGGYDKAIHLWDLSKLRSGDDGRRGKNAGQFPLRPARRRLSVRTVCYQ
jgi:WD40 repeat protein